LQFLNHAHFAFAQAVTFRVEGRNCRFYLGFTVSKHVRHVSRSDRIEGLPIPLLSGQLYPVMPTIDLTEDELAAVTAAIRRLIEDDRFPHAPRLDPLRSALAKLDAPQAPPPVQGGKRTRR
jgi:hypothetical protein